MSRSAAWAFSAITYPPLACRPKIQRLVTPMRLQRRRHLRSLKRRKLEHQKEQKSEYEYVLPPSPNPVLHCLSSALIAKRVAEKKAKAAAIKASHKARA